MAYSTDFETLSRNAMLLEREQAVRPKTIPTPVASTPQSAGSNPASTSPSQAANAPGSSQNVNIEVQVKFDNEMFKKNVVNICMDNSRKIAENGFQKG